MIECVFRVIDSARNRSTLHRLSFACPIVVSHDGPLGPGFFPPPGEYSGRYFRFFSALWNDSRVEGLIIIAALTIRSGFRNNDQKPGRARSPVDRLGARCLDLLWMISCCFRGRLFGEFWTISRTSPAQPALFCTQPRNGPQRSRYTCRISISAPSGSTQTATSARRS